MEEKSQKQYQDKILSLQKEIQNLKEENKKYKERKTYGLVWDNEKNKEQIVEDCKNKLPILERVKEKEIITDKNKPMNLMIEGDNYHALTCLNYTHKGKVDLIYIDPPYNTGNKSWKYNNKYIEKDDVYLHSKWINMMYHRLSLARNLLNEDGCLVCAIDENEVSNLNILLKSIFSSYVVDQIAIVHNPRGIQGNNFSYNHEYALFVYPNNSKKYIANTIREQVLERNFRVDGSNSPRNTAKNCFYSINIRDDKIIGFGDVEDESFHPNQTIVCDNETFKVYPIDINGIERKWSFARHTVEEIASSLMVKKVNDRFEIKRLKYSSPYKTVWIGNKFDANEYGSKLINSIINTGFDYPKSLYTVYECISTIAQNNPNAIILDFFAGSGTTGHAVMELNKQDGGNRQFILCTNNEGNIATEVCYPRVKKVIEGYDFKGKDITILYENKLNLDSLKKMKDLLQEVNNIIEEEKANYNKIEKEFKNNVLTVKGIKNIKDKKQGLGGNLHYFKADASSFISVDTIKNVSDKKKLELTLKAGELIAIKENIFDEIEQQSF